MNPFYSSEFHFRIVFIVLAAVLLISALIPKTRAILLDSISNDRLSDRTRNRALIAACATYFVVASLCKYSQLTARLMSGNDFWLFVDMFRYMARGEPYVTRFTWLAIGPIQHGVIHAYLTIWFLVPLTWLIGPTGTAVVLIPACFAFGGLIIGKLVSTATRSTLVILGLPMAFWMSEWTNRILNYETHPEAAYIPLSLLAYFSATRLKLNPSKLNWLWFVLSWVALCGMKQDAVVVGLLIWFFLLVNRQFKIAPAVASLAITVGLFCLMTKLISGFNAGSIGTPNIFIGDALHPVAIPKVGAVGLNGHTLSSAAAVIDAVKSFFGGGISNVAAQVTMFILLSQFLLLTLIAPWLWFTRSFWYLVMPFAILIGLMNNVIATLTTYNSSIFVALLWLSCCIELQNYAPRRQRAVVLFAFIWTFVFCGVHGGTSPVFFSESETSIQTTRETNELLKKADGIGVVSTRLLSDVDEHKVWGDVISRFYRPELDPPEFVKWVIFPKTNASYEFSNTNFERWRIWALKNGHWKTTTTDTVELLTRTD